jgi:hypothetical protein
MENNLNYTSRGMVLYMDMKIQGFNHTKIQGQAVGITSGNLKTMQREV